MNSIFPELPTKLGIYSLTRLLGARENSELYSATQSYVDRVVAIEVLRPNSSPELVEFFQETARCRAAANLPHVSPVLESTQTGHLRYLIQELPKGKSLADRISEDGPLSVDQAFTFVQTVADLYCACINQKMAANPLTLSTVYMDGDSFSFFSPVIAGEMTAALRTEQMEALAGIIESILPPQEIEKSNLSIILHWLRHGYGDTALEWGPLASSLSTLRAQKFAPQKESIAWRELLNPASLKRRARRLLRSWRSHLGFCWAMGGLLLAAFVAIILLQFFSRGEGESLSAVTDQFVYCGVSAGKICRVQVRPVSISEYGKFLEAFDRMSPSQKKVLCEGMPEDTQTYIPLQWNEQNMAAGLNMEWQGRRVTPESPVCGVSYWGALAYARFVEGKLPSITQLRATRQQVGEPLVEEWTSSSTSASFPVEPSYIVCPAYGGAGEPVYELVPTRQEKQRSFRVAFDANN